MDNNGTTGATTEPVDLGRLIPVRYRLDVDGPHTVYLESREQRDGSTLWAVTDGPFVLSSEGIWEYEPLPSNRDEAFISRTRYASPVEAATSLDAARRRERQEAQAWKERGQQQAATEGRETL